MLLFLNVATEEAETTKLNMIHAMVNARTRKLRIAHAYFSGLGSFFRLSITTKVEYTKSCAPPISLLLLSDA